MGALCLVFVARDGFGAEVGTMLRRFQVFCSGPEGSQAQSVEAENRQQALDWARKTYPGCQCAAVDAALVDLAKTARPGWGGES
jgi:hypothetical protein